MKIKFPEKLIESFAKYYALQIEMGWITIDDVPEQFKERTQYYVDLSNQNKKLRYATTLEMRLFYYVET